MVGEQPLDVVVGILHPFEVLTKFCLDLTKEKVAMGYFGLVAVEEHVGEFVGFGVFENVRYFVVEFAEAKRMFNKEKSDGYLTFLTAAFTRFGS